MQIDLANARKCCSSFMVMGLGHFMTAFHTLIYLVPLSQDHVAQERDGVSVEFTLFRFHEETMLRQVSQNLP